MGGGFARDYTRKRSLPKSLFFLFISFDDDAAKADAANTKFSLPFFFFNSLPFWLTKAFLLTFFSFFFFGGWPYTKEEE